MATINIEIKRSGHTPGTIGWLAENAKSINIAKTQDGGTGAWLRDQAGSNITLLAYCGDETDGSPEPVVRRTDRFGYPAVADRHFTDAAWAIVKQLAREACDAMCEDEALAKSYAFTLEAR